MACACYQKSALCAVTTADQTVTAGGVVNFATNNLLTGTSIQHVAGASAVTIPNSGLYQVTFDADVLPSEAGGVTIQLYNNNVAVSGAQASFTGAATSLVHISFTTLIKVLQSCNCINNAASLQVQSADALTIGNANITVVKLA